MSRVAPSFTIPVHNERQRRASITLSPINVVQQPNNPIKVLQGTNSSRIRPASVAQLSLKPVASTGRRSVDESHIAGPNGHVKSPGTPTTPNNASSAKGRAKTTQRNRVVASTPSTPHAPASPVLVPHAPASGGNRSRQPSEDTTGTGTGALKKKPAVPVYRYERTKTAPSPAGNTSASSTATNSSNANAAKEAALAKVKQAELEHERVLARKAYQAETERTGLRALDPTRKPRARLIDRKPNLRAQTNARATVGASATLTRGASANGNATGGKPPVRRAGPSVAVVPLKSQPHKVNGAGVKQPRAAQTKGLDSGAASTEHALPGSIAEESAALAIAPLTVRHDRHTSMAVNSTLVSLSNSRSHSKSEDDNTAATDTAVTTDTYTVVTDSKLSLPRLTLIERSGLDSHTLSLASVYINNANAFHSPHHRDNVLALQLYHFYRHPIIRTLVFVLVLLNMLLTYMEEKPELNRFAVAVFELFLLVALTGWAVLELYLYPSRMKRSKQKLSLSRWLPHIKYFTLPHLPHRWAVWRSRYHCHQWKDSWDQLRLLILFVSFVDLFISGFGYGYEYRVVKPLRAYFVCSFSHDTRIQAKQVFGTVRAMLIPFAMVSFTIFVQAGLGMIFFHQSTSVDNQGDYFADLLDAFLDMFTLLTTSNFPDISFEAIDEYGLYASLYFIICMTSTVYITTNVLIATVYSTWREQAVIEYWQKLKRREASLKMAFKLLVAGSVSKWHEEKVKDKIAKEAERAKHADSIIANLNTATAIAVNASRNHDVGDGEPHPTGGCPNASTGDEDPGKDCEKDAKEESRLSLIKWTGIFSYMHPRLSDTESAILSRVFFLLLTTTSTTECSESDFLDLTEHLQSLNSLTMKDAIEPKTKNALRIESQFEYPLVQYLRAALAVGSAIIALYAFQTADDSSDIYQPWSFTLDFLYALWLCAEIGLAVYINNWRRFWSSPWKRASLAIAVLSIGGKIVIEFVLQPAIDDDTLTLFRLATFFRLIRTLRVPLVIKRFRLGLKSLVRVFAPLRELLFYLLVIYYLYALLGMALFAHRLGPDNPALAGTDFVTSHYANYFSFDDFPSAWFTLYHFMTLTNFDVTVQALMLATSRWAYLYYLSFFFIVALCTLSLVIAYLIETIEVLTKNLTEARADKETDRQQRLEAEQWAKEMIAVEEEEELYFAQQQRYRSSSVGNNHGTSEGETDDTHWHTSNDAGNVTEVASPVTRLPPRTTTVTAPTIGKKKKRTGVFDEDALRHAENMKDEHLDEESLSRVSRVHSDDSVSDLYFMGIGDEIGANTHSQHGHAHTSDNPSNESYPASHGVSTHTSHGDGIEGTPNVGTSTTAEGEPVPDSSAADHAERAMSTTRAALKAAVLHSTQERRHGESAQLSALSTTSAAPVSREREMGSAKHSSHTLIESRPLPPAVGTDQDLSAAASTASVQASTTAVSSPTLRGTRPAAAVEAVAPKLALSSSQPAASSSSASTLTSAMQTTITAAIKSSTSTPAPAPAGAKSVAGTTGTSLSKAEASPTANTSMSGTPTNHKAKGNTVAAHTAALPGSPTASAARTSQRAGK